MKITNSDIVQFCLILLYCSCTFCYLTAHKQPTLQAAEQTDERDGAVTAVIAALAAIVAITTVATIGTTHMTRKGIAIVDALQPGAIGKGSRRCFW